jgi:hypothetical protein
MVAAHPNYRFPSTGSNTSPAVSQLAQRVDDYFSQHPDVSRQEFLLEALQREIRFREQREARNGAGLGHGEAQWSTGWSHARSPLSAEDTRIHRWLVERLARVDYERHGLWPRLKRLLFENRLVRWLRKG